MAGVDLKSIVDRIVDLPTLPQVVTKIMSLIDDPRSSAKEVNEVMGKDPALAARILKLVNSSFYGFAKRVTSIQQAITILGFNTVKSLAISASVFDMFDSDEEVFSYEAFWTHSIGTAFVAQKAARLAPPVSADTAFVVGLLHGMGLLVLDQYAPQEFQFILKVAKTQKSSFHQAESQVLQTSYTEVGYWLAKRWQLAQEVQNAILHQHHPAQCAHDDRPLVAILALAVYVSRTAACGACGDFDTPTLPPEVWDILGVPEEKREPVLARLTLETAKTGDFLGGLRS